MTDNNYTLKIVNFKFFDTKFGVIWHIWAKMQPVFILVSNSRRYPAYNLYPTNPINNIVLDLHCCNLESKIGIRE